MIFKTFLFKCLLLLNSRFLVASLQLLIIRLNKLMHRRLTVEGLVWFVVLAYWSQAIPHTKTWDVFASLRSSTSDNVTITTIDCPKINHFLDILKFFVNILENRFLVAGNFNAKYAYWESSLIIPKRRQLWHEAFGWMVFLVTSRMAKNVYSSKKVNGSLSYCYYEAWHKRHFPTVFCGNPPER